MAPGQKSLDERDICTERSMFKFHSKNDDVVGANSQDILIKFSPQNRAWVSPVSICFKPLFLCFNRQLIYFHPFWWKVSSFNHIHVFNQIYSYLANLRIFLRWLWITAHIPCMITKYDTSERIILFLSCWYFLNFEKKFVNFYRVPRNEYIIDLKCWLANQTNSWHFGLYIDSSGYYVTFKKSYIILFICFRPIYMENKGMNGM